MNIRSTLLVVFFYASLLLTGCASIVNDSTHGIKVETLTPDGTVVSGADCKLTNDYGVIQVKSGDLATLHRSSSDLDITCRHPSHPDAYGRAVSRANGGMWGNILLGGGIGAIVDHNKGTAYAYPVWMQLVFGKSLVFDRSTEKEGQPTQGVAPGSKTVAAEKNEKP